ncbi:hypothetical protein KIH87_02810 [Paraneptunicella aestuarii]|uniref:P-loop NTPase fold protein n=1 Tax=Paraneptunicella aestuarii TaxID=2831148 RepID=UPI001E4A6CF6|nr:P-loop NTPase fold protein [Paraneptunicella aestuarii]UAA39312.1 hypothetical protein KIH87_02810 [Paraneptunicella aestuarii]
MANETSNQANDGYIFNVLHEEVSDTDAFEEKTHERISQSLYSLITTARKACTIGLEGAWGSGKSTVINLLRNKLKADQNDDAKERTLFYVFDAWAHDGDTLRKTFLEELILEVAKDNNIKSKQLDPRLKEIRERASGRKKTITTENTKQISNYAKWLAVSILAFPLGATLLSKVDFDKLYAPWDKIAGDINWLFFFGIVFTSLPFVITLFNAIRSYIDPDYSFALLNPNHKETLTQSITQDIDRTSIEFEGFFKKIMSYLLTGTRRQSYTRVILVIDNLDRIDAEHAKNIWITLQTFFQHRSGNVNAQDSDWLDRVWFIVPFDRDGLSKIWDGNSPHPQVVLSNKDEFGLQATYDYSNTRAQLADSYIDKCFQIVVEVPQAIPNNWIGYLKEKMQEAFSNSYSKSEVDILIDTFIGYESSLEISPTPRKINTVINRIGMLGLQWGQQFSMQAYCLYALLRQANNSAELRQKLVSKNISLSFLNIDTSALYPELSGLFFGVPKEQGMQLLLVPVIEQYIEEEKYDYLKELVLNHNQAFWIAWGIFDNQNAPDKKPSLYKREYAFLKSAIYLISKLFNDNEISEQTKNNAFLRRTISSLSLEGILHWTSNYQNLEHDYYPLIDPLISLTKQKQVIEFEKIGMNISQAMLEITQDYKDGASENIKVENLNKLIELFENSSLQFKIQSRHFLKHETWEKWIKKHGKTAPICSYIRYSSGIISYLYPDTSIDHLAFEIRLSNLYSLLEYIQDEKELNSLISRILHTYSHSVRSEIFGRNKKERSDEVSIPYSYTNYKLLLHAIMNHPSLEQVSSVYGSMNTEQFWKGGIEPGFSSPLCLLTAVVFKENLFTNKYIPDNIKNFWESHSELTDRWSKYEREVIQFLKELKQLNYLQKLAKIEGYNYAKQIVANNPELFDTETSE